ncbi:MAG: alcohol dehydrogenase catalytic domain-containing protein [Planctomycetota bacterium]|nr:alcohol dehydrogenase catalytic domain-containing protein [Planctomycetota bacterium]
MRVVQLLGRQVSFVPAYTEPLPAVGEVVVRVLAAGICETDLQLAKGYMGFCGVLGHEFVGIAETGRYAGQRVVGEINCSCHSCPSCLRGLANHCPHRSVLGILGRNGAFAEQLILPERNLHPVPESIPTWAAVFTEPLAAAFRIGEQVSLAPGLQTVILGDGRLGNLCAQVLKSQGCQVTVVGKHHRKMSLLERLGISTRAVSNPPPRASAALVVDCTGSGSGLATALTLVQPGGTVVLKTTIAAEHKLPLAPVVIDEVRVVGSRCGPFAPALAALAQGAIELAPLVEATVSLEETPAAITRAANSPTLKILIDVAGEMDSMG